MWQEMKENRFFIENVFLSFWQFSKLCSELQGPSRAEDGKFIFSGSAMFEIYRGGASEFKVAGAVWEWRAEHRGAANSLVWHISVVKGWKEEYTKLLS